MTPTKLQASAALAIAVTEHRYALNIWLRNQTDTDASRSFRVASNALDSALAAYEATPDEATILPSFLKPPEPGNKWIMPVGGNPFARENWFQVPTESAKATPDEKPGADWIAACVAELWTDTFHTEEEAAAIIAKHAPAQPAAVSASDSERLDWLDSSKRTLSHLFTETEQSTWSHQGNGWHNSARGAIDAAIEAERAAKAQP